MKISKLIKMLIKIRLKYGELTFAVFDKHNKTFNLICGMDVVNLLDAKGKVQNTVGLIISNVPMERLNDKKKVENSEPSESLELLKQAKNFKFADREDSNKING